MQTTLLSRFGSPSRALAVLRRPATQTDLVQVGKTVVAAVGAWMLAVDVFGLSQPFLAPWAAMLTVHATVYRSLSRSVQSVAATGLGILLAFVVAEVLGVGTAALGVALLLGLLLSRAGLLRHEGVTIATTALFVITTGQADDEGLLIFRLFDTTLGVAVGLAVNVIVLPPLNNRSAEQQIDSLNRQMGELMSEMAEEMRHPWTEENSRGWIDRTRDMDDDLSRAWELVNHARESSRWNPRRRAVRRAAEQMSYENVLRRLEDGIAQLRSIARTVDESTRSAQEWDARFREPWLDLLTETGQRIADPDADVEVMRERLDELTRELSDEALQRQLWPVYGALIANLLNVVTVVDDVASSRPVRP